MRKIFYVALVLMLAGPASAATADWSFTSGRNSIGSIISGDGSWTVDTPLDKGMRCENNDIVYTEDPWSYPNGITVEILVKLESRHQQYLAFKPGVFLVQITDDGHLQAGVYVHRNGNAIWTPLVNDHYNMNTGVWQDIVFTYDNNVAKLFIDGRQVGVNYSRVGIPDGGKILYFCNRPAKDRDMDGTIERVRISDFVMSPTRIAEVYGGETNGLFLTRSIGSTYRSQAQVVTALNNLDERFPSQVRSEVIGKTLQGRDILMYKIGNANADETFMFTGKLHGPEDCGTESGYRFVEHILTANTPQTRNILSQIQLLFIPGINLDIPARQNRRRSYSDGTHVPHGVDLNRNFPHQFGRTGSGNSYDSYQYRGVNGNSEPETQAVTSAIRRYRPDILLDVHCGMQTLVGYKSGSLANNIISKIRDVSSATSGSQTMSKFNPYVSGTVAGGYAAYQALEYGGNGWLFEVSNWEDMPKTLHGYHERWWKHVYPVYMGMALSLL